MDTPDQEKANERPSEMLSATQLCKAANIGWSLFYRMKGLGYRMEFELIRRTTLKHFQDWLRAQGDRFAAEDVERHRLEQERMELELRRLRESANKPREPKARRGSRVSAKGAK